MKPIGYDKTKTASLMKENNLDFLVISTPENLLYTSGLPIRQAAKNPILFVLANQYPTIVVIDKDGQESLIVWDLFPKEKTWIENIKGISSIKKAVKNLVTFIKKADGDNLKIGIESLMPYYQFEALKKAFPDADINSNIGDKILLDMRLIKSDEEVKFIKESTRISEQAINRMIEETKVGMSDLEYSKLAKKTMIDEGADGFDHVTLSIGDSNPEAPGSGRKLEENEITRFDIGALYEGYSSDVSRHAVVGEVVPEANNIINAVIEVQNTCEKSIKPGILPKEIYDIAQQKWKEIGRIDPLILTCHSVGIGTEEFHYFDPMTQKAAKRPFEKNNVMDIEAWAVVPKVGLVGNEDTYQVTDLACKRISNLEMKLFKK